MKAEKRAAWLVCSIVLAVIMFFFVTTVARTLTRQLLVKRLGIENAFTRFVLSDVKELAENDGEDSAQTKAIDWEASYPFQSGPYEMILPSGEENQPALPERITQSVRSVENDIENYCTDFLFGYRSMVELANQYEALLHWSYASYDEYNGVIRLADGHLSSLIDRKDVSAEAENTVTFHQFCEDRGIRFVYIQTPCKISETQDPTVSGEVDFSNQNADDLLARLRQEGIEVCDLREAIEAEHLEHHALFYRTDHHWRGETGLWAAQHILEYLSQTFQYNTDPSLLNPDRFTEKTYPEWFLGSQGKKVTLSVAKPEDFTLLYPSYETHLRFSAPDADVELEGDFSILYDMRRVEKRDYYDEDPYETFMYGNRPLAHFENLLAENDLHLLVIHDSFGNCVLPFLSLGVRSIDALDLRVFTGSVQSFVEQTRPDAVIVLYNPTSINHDRALHEGTFDFS